MYVICRLLDVFNQLLKYGNMQVLFARNLSLWQSMPLWTSFRQLLWIFVWY